VFDNKLEVDAHKRKGNNLRRNKASCNRDVIFCPSALHSEDSKGIRGRFGHEGGYLVSPWI
jgi:hypothetical protein